jgi:hypothetical protein
MMKETVDSNSAKTDSLFRVQEQEYGSNYPAHYMDIYKLYVDMADKVSTRRQTANSFFLTLNTGIIAFVSYLHAGEAKICVPESYWVISLAGMALCYMWYRLIRSYKGLNSGKFKIIHQIEQRLPLAPFDAEWEVLGRGKKRSSYLPFTRVEMAVPWVFFLLHVLVCYRCFPWLLLRECLVKSFSGS